MLQGYVFEISVRETFPSDSELESDDISMCPQEVRTSSFDLPRAQGGCVLGEERDNEGKSPLDTQVRACPVIQACPTLCDAIDCSPPGFSVLGIFQADTGVGCQFLLHTVVSPNYSQHSSLSYSQHSPLRILPNTEALRTLLNKVAAQNPQHGSRSISFST